jgi:hypothetical protein
MLNEIDAFEKGLCANCEKNIRGELTALDSQKYKTSALCPDCWYEFIKNKSKYNDKLPQQLGLPLIGDSPKKIEMGPLPLGALVTHDSKLLRDCIIECVYRGPLCYFRVITPNHETSKGILDYIRGVVNDRAET